MSCFFSLSIGSKVTLELESVKTCTFDTAVVVVCDKKVEGDGWGF